MAGLSFYSLIAQLDWLSISFPGLASAVVEFSKDGKRADLEYSVHFIPGSGLSYPHKSKIANLVFINSEPTLKEASGLLHSLGTEVLDFTDGLVMLLTDVLSRHYETSAKGIERATQLEVSGGSIRVYEGLTRVFEL